MPKPPPPKGRPTSPSEPTKSILALATSAESATKEHYSFLLLGQSKTGKTTAFGTMPGNKLAIALTTRTAPALRGTSNCQIITLHEDQPKKKRDPKSGNENYGVTPHAWDDLWTLLNELWALKDSPEPFPYDAIMLDDLSAANDFAMNNVLNLNKGDGSAMSSGLAGAPAEHHYVPQMFLIQQLIYSILLPLPCHIVVCGHTELREDKTSGRFYYFPIVFGNLRTKIASWFDEVYETDKVAKAGEPTRYVWKTEGSGQKRIFGSTINKQNSLWQSPLDVTLGQSPCGFAKVLERR